MRCEFLLLPSFVIKWCHVALNLIILGYFLAAWRHFLLLFHVSCEYIYMLLCEPDRKELTYDMHFVLLCLMCRLNKIH